MKIKLCYPKIPNVLTLNFSLKKCVAFNKEDGTLIHIVYNFDKGFSSFGTRRDRYTFNKNGLSQFHKEHNGLYGLSQALDKLLDYYPMDYYFKNAEPYCRAKEIILSAEFFGPNSFAGNHSILDLKDERQLVLFDLQQDGIMTSPYQFIDDFASKNICSTPKIIYKGKYNGQLFRDVRNNIFNLKEGVVVKGVIDNKVYMVKIKTNSYEDKLKAHFKTSWEKYWE